MNLSVVAIVRSTYNSVFSLLAILVWIEFLRKRKSFCIKERFPIVVLLQLAIPILLSVIWIIADQSCASIGKDFAANSQQAPVPCLCGLHILGYALASFAGLMLVLRMWLLFRRFFIGHYYLRQREAIRRTCISRSKDMDHAKVDIADSLRAFNRQSLGTRYVVQYAVPLAFGTIFVIWIYRYVACVAKDHCMPAGFGALSTAMWLTLLLAVATVGLLMRNFKDVFNIASEFRRVAALGVFVFFPLMIILYYTAGDISFQFVLCCSQAIFVVSGVLPLFEQCKLERIVARGDIRAYEKFDELLLNNAALLAFENFLRREFCQELLQFYQAVDKYKHAYDLATSQQQVDNALKIYTVYLAPNSPSQINVSSSDREAIENELLLVVRHMHHRRVYASRLLPRRSTQHFFEQVRIHLEEANAERLREPTPRFHDMNSVATPTLGSHSQAPSTAGMCSSPVVQDVDGEKLTDFGERLASLGCEETTPTVIASANGSFQTRPEGTSNESLMGFCERLASLGCEETTSTVIASASASSQTHPEGTSNASLMDFGDRLASLGREHTTSNASSVLSHRIPDGASNESLMDFGERFRPLGSETNTLEVPASTSAPIKEECEEASCASSAAKSEDTPPRTRRSSLSSFLRKTPRVLPKSLSKSSSKKRKNKASARSLRRSLTISALPPAAPPISSQSESQTNVSATVFDDAQAEMRHLLVMDSFMRFQWKVAEEQTQRRGGHGRGDTIAKV